ncbi:MAG: YhcH/YjgK/YiaL family protein [Oscillospiraceae bacterium]|nr:YhcH/YjgK/YiaL family protein [Oscillospiraceae bacterium]
MIYDKIENMPLYFDNLKGFEKVYEVTKEYQKNPFESGRIDIDGDNAWCNVNTYNLEAGKEIKYESHKKYADVQVMIDGEEYIGWAPKDECKITEDFKDGSDIAFMTAQNGQNILLRKGYFTVFFPGDAHAPCIKSENSDFANKLVFKIKL